MLTPAYFYGTFGTSLLINLQVYSIIRIHRLKRFSSLEQCHNLEWVVHSCQHLNPPFGCKILSRENASPKRTPFFRRLKFDIQTTSSLFGNLSSRADSSCKKAKKIKFHGYSTNPPRATYPPEIHKGLIAGLIKGNQWLISPDHKFPALCCGTFLQSTFGTFFSQLVGLVGREQADFCCARLFETFRNGGPILIFVNFIESRNGDMKGYLFLMQHYLFWIFSLQIRLG